MLFSISLLGFAIPIIYDIFLLIDSWIYRIAQNAFMAFFELVKISSNTSAWSDQIGYIISRVMVLAGVFALFRVAVLLINYLIDPSKVDAATKNGASYLKSVIIAIFLLVGSKWIFGQLADLERLVLIGDTGGLNGGLIPKLVYGPDKAVNEDDFRTQSKQFVNRVFLLFFEEKNEGTCSGTDNKLVCQNVEAVSNGDTAGILRLIGYEYGSNEFTYTPIISGIAGIMLIYYFIMFSIELAKRIVKMLVLQVISPIPIIMSIDPSQKNRLTTFAKSYFGLYIQVFIRVLTFYLAFVCVGLIMNFNNEIISNALISNNLLLSGGGAILKVALILGIFQAANELPKLIEDAMGVKLGMPSGAKGFGKTLGAIIGGGAGFIGGSIAGGISGAASGGIRGALGGVLGGGVSAMLAGGKAGASGNVGQTISGAVKSFSKGASTGRTIGNTGGLINYGMGWANHLIGHNARVDRKVSAITEKQDAIDKFKEKAELAYAKSINKNNTSIENVPSIREKVLRRNDLELNGTNSGIFKEMMKDNNTLGSKYHGVFNGLSNDTDRLRKAIEIADNEYSTELDKEKTIALQKFANNSNNDGYRTDIEALYNNPSQHASLSDVQKAYYEMLRANPELKSRVETDASGHLKGKSQSFEDEMSDISKETKKSLKEAKAYQNTDRYIHQQNVEGSNKKN